MEIQLHRGSGGIVALACLLPADGGTGQVFDVQYDIPTSTLPLALLKQMIRDGIDVEIPLVIESVEIFAGTAVLKTTSFPGRTYQIQTSETLGAMWEDVFGAQATAPPREPNVYFTNAISGLTQKFFRVRQAP